MPRQLMLVLLSLVTLFHYALSQETCPGSDIIVILDPVDQVVDIGNTNIRFNCAYANLDPGMFYQWQHYPLYGNVRAIGMNITERKFYIDPINGDLIISVVEAMHIGSYACTANTGVDGNGCFVSTANASLTVRGPPDLNCIDEDENNCSYTVMSNQNITAAITLIIGSFEEPDFILYKSGDDGSRTRVSGDVFHLFLKTDGTRLSISLQSPRVADSGTYQVVANNSLGTSIKEFTITVTGPDPPEITIPSLVLSAFDSRVRVNCSVQPNAANQGIMLAWHDPDNNVVVTASEMSSLVVLDIPSLVEGDMGMYRCVANNSRGNMTKRTRVCGPASINEKPVVAICDSPCVRKISWDMPMYTCTTIVNYTITLLRQGTLQEEFMTATGTEYEITNELEAGMYSVTVTTTVGESGTFLSGPSSEETTFEVDPPTTDGPGGDEDYIAIVAGVVAGVVILIVIGAAIAVFFLCVYYPHRKGPNSQEQTWSPDEELENGGMGVPNTYTTLKLPPTDLPPSPDNVPYSYFSAEVDPKWEFPRENIQLTEVLNEGQFTILYKGVARGFKEKPLDIAVKSVRDDVTEDDVKALIAEMELLASIGDHPNIVSLICVCTVKKPIYMVVEYMCHGDLLGFLRGSRGHHGMYTVSPGINNQPPCLNLSSRDLLSVAAKIANGMRFLADRKIVHRALCCRNVLVGTGFEIKIYNVGAFDMDNRDSLLLKWMAPETLFDGTNTTYSDVWSFGVTLWELVTVGGTPYAEILPEDLYTQLHAGMRMPKPPHCAQEVYDVMRKCWEHNPTGRPHFSDIHDRIDNLSASKVSYLDLRSYNAVDYSQYDEPPQLSTAL